MSKALFGIALVGLGAWGLNGADTWASLITAVCVWIMGFAFIMDRGNS